MLILLQRTLAYIEEQNAWLSYLQSTIAEKERDYKTLHSMISKEITKEVGKQHMEAEDDVDDKAEEDEEVVVKMEHPDIEEFVDIQTTTVMTTSEVQNKIEDDFNSDSLFHDDCNNPNETEWTNVNEGTGHINRHESRVKVEHQETNHYHVYQDDDTQAHNKITIDRHQSSNNMTVKNKMADINQSKNPPEAIYSDDRATIQSYNNLNQSQSASKVPALRHTCHHCKKSFSLHSSLKRHLRNHTGEKPYKCLYCEKSFYRSDLRGLHMRVHTGEKPYKCTYCDKSFSHISNRNMHVLTHNTTPK